MDKVKLIAYYLPQFHPISENDFWWGKGFTEWTNVGKAKKLYFSHDQPKVPADLGYYDLRIPEIREEQALLAKEAGVEAFCYWHYYFGEGKRLLHLPFDEVVKLKRPDFPFCLAWANHSWYNKTWKIENGKSSNTNKLLIEQLYPGKHDVDLHFNLLFDAFRDQRYYKIDNKLVFVLYRPLEIPYLQYFIERWQALAKKNKLNGFYFIAHTYKLSEVVELKQLPFDAINLSLHHEPFLDKKSKFNIIKRYISSEIFGKPEIVEYSKAISKMESELFTEDNIFPTIIPNWDHTPRSGSRGRVLHNSTPELFGKHVENVFKLIRNKKDDNLIVFLKSWNEWAEGNYMEPDIKYGKAYIETLKGKVLDFNLTSNNMDE